MNENMSVSVSHPNVSGSLTVKPGQLFIQGLEALVKLAIQTAPIWLPLIGAGQAPQQPSQNAS